MISSDPTDLICRIHWPEPSAGPGPPRGQRTLFTLLKKFLQAADLVAVGLTTGYHIARVVWPVIVAAVILILKIEFAIVSEIPTVVAFAIGAAGTAYHAARSAASAARAEAAILAHLVFPATTPEPPTTRSAVIYRSTDGQAPVAR